MHKVYNRIPYRVYLQTNFTKCFRILNRDEGV